MEVFEALNSNFMSQVASFIVEINVTWLVPAYHFFPLTGGIAAGEIIRKFVSNHTGVTIWIFLFCFLLPASLLCLFYRHNAASKINQVNKKQKQKVKNQIIEWLKQPLSREACDDFNSYFPISHRLRHLELSNDLRAEI